VQQKKKIKGFNERRFTQDDFFRLARREKIIVHFWHLEPGINGFYGVNRKGRRSYRYIVINAKLVPGNWLSTGFHELMHHFLHQPASKLAVYFSRDSITAIQDREADRFLAKRAGADAIRDRRRRGLMPPG